MRHLLLASLLVACSAKEPVDTGAAPSLGEYGDTGSTCSGTAPVITSLSCENTGLQPHFETKEPTVTMTIEVQISDDDGDLQSYQLDMWFDDDIDGSVDTSGVQFDPQVGTLDAPECGAENAQISSTLYLTGGTPSYNTSYEWAVQVTDAAGIPSEVEIKTCVTPMSDGSDGTGAG